MNTMFFNPETMKVRVIDTNRILTIIELEEIQNYYVLATNITPYEEQAEYMFRAATSRDKTHNWTIESFQKFREKMRE
jgi:hypothetical protein